MRHGADVQAVNDAGENALILGVREGHDMFVRGVVSTKDLKARSSKRITERLVEESARLQKARAWRPLWDRVLACGEGCGEGAGGEARDMHAPARDLAV